MTRPLFQDRADAGRRLGDRVAGLGLSDPVVLGLARGGVVVAALVAAALDVGVEVFVARKIGHPRQPEYGIGAVAEEGAPVYDDAALGRFGLVAADLAAVVAGEIAELGRRVRSYRGDRVLPDLTGRDVVLVDDGVATGVTARAALAALRDRRPKRLVLAAPVGAPSSVAALAQVAEEVVVLRAPANLGAVGRWYVDFGQVSDAEVLRLLASAPAG